MKEFYASLIDTTRKKAEVKVHEVKVSYSKATPNLVLGLSSVEATYQNLLENYDYQDFNVYMESFCNSGTKWAEVGGEKTVRRMDLRPARCSINFSITIYALLCIMRFLARLGWY